MNFKLIFVTCFAAVIVAGCGNIGNVGYGVDELAEQAVADKETFMGKEVVVSGYVSIISDDIKGKVVAIHLDFDLQSATERQVSCTIADGQIPGITLKKWITVKGKISNIRSTNYMDQRSVTLDPCEIAS